jgi:acetyl-CoA acetyltransferase
MSRSPAIVGFGEFIEKESALTVCELLGRAADKALQSAGLERSAIDGLVTTSLVGTFEDPPFRSFWGTQVSHYLGIRPRYIDYVEFGGPSYEAFVWRAQSAIRSGLAKTVLCVGGGKGSARKKRRIPPDLSANSWFTNLYYWNDFKPTSDYGMLAALHARRYGTKDEQRAKLAVDQRENATTNPASIFKGSLSVEQVLGSPMIASPLHLLEIVPVVDGAHAFIMTSELGSIRNQPVFLAGYGEAHDPSFLCERDDILDLPVTASSKRAFESSGGLKLDDLDFAQLYDSYTITTLLELEGIGFCEQGKAGRFIETTDFSKGGSLPMNTGGGSLNVGQTAYMSGGVILIEALRQLMGMGGSGQVGGARTGLVNGLGGNDTINHSVTLLLSNGA